MKRMLCWMLALLIGCLPLIGAAAESDMPVEIAEAGAEPDMPFDASDAEAKPDMSFDASDAEAEDGEIISEMAEPEIAEEETIIIDDAEETDVFEGIEPLPEEFPADAEGTASDTLTASSNGYIEIIELEDRVLWNPGGTVNFSPYLYHSNDPLYFTWQKLDLNALPANATADERAAAWVTLVDAEEGHDTLRLENYDPTLRERYRVIVSDGETAKISNEAQVLICCEGGPEYVIDSKGGLRYYQGSGGDLVIPSDLGIKFIGGESVEYGNPFLDAPVTSIYVPDGIWIGHSAFWNCKQLRRVRLPSDISEIGHDAFHGCSALEEITIPDTVINVRYNAFQDCTSLRRLDFPISVKYVGQDVLAGCTGLEEISFALRSGSNERPSVSGCTSLKRATVYVWGEFGGSIVTYAINIFKGCPLETLTLTGTMTTLHGRALSQWSGDAFTLELPDGVTGITEPELIPSTVLFKARPGSQTFQTLLDVGIGPIVFDSGAFGMAMIGGVAVVMDYHGSNSRVAIPAEVYGYPVAGISEDAFAGHGELAAVELPESLLAIGAGAFAGCDSICDMVIPKQTAIYGENALAGHVSVYPNSLAALYCRRYRVSHTLLVVESLTLSRESLILAPNRKATLTVRFEPAGLHPEITFTSSKSSVATVNSAGVITAKKNGTAIITVTADEMETTCRVTVGKAPSKVTVKAPATAVGVGDVFDVTAAFNRGAVSEVTFSSTDPSVLTVDSRTGHVQALAEGSASIVATATNGKRGSLTIRVGSQATALTMNQNAAVLAKGASLTLKPTLTGGSAVIAYASSDEAVATVDARGVAKAVGGGEAVITASTTGGLSAECALTVNEVRLTARSTILAVGDALTLNVELLPTSEAGATVKSSNAKVAKITRSGDQWIVQGVKAGTATLTASSNGARATLKITVKKKARRGSLILPEGLGVGERITLKAKTGASSYASIAQVEVNSAAAGQVEYANGQLTGTCEGLAQVRAQLYDGQWTPWQSLSVVAPPTDGDMYVTLNDDWLEGSGSIQTTPGPRRDFALRVAKGDQATVRARYCNGATGTHTAASTNESILKIEGDVVRFVGVGSAAVIYTAYNGAQTRMDFQVLPAPKTVKIVGDNPITGGFKGFIGVLTNRGAWDPLTQTLDTGYDYLTLSVKSSNPKAVPLARLDDRLAFVNIGGRHSFRATAKSAGAKAKVSVKLFNSVKTSMTIKGRKNRLGISSKPDKRIIAALNGGVGAWLKSLECTSAGKLVAEYYFVNGTNQKFSGRLDGTGAELVLNGQRLAWKSLDGVKVSVKKKSYVVVKVTFSGSEINTGVMELPDDLWQYGRIAFDGGFVR